VKTAVRVANVPAERFDEAVESDTPPTVMKLAEMHNATRARAPLLHRALQPLFHAVEIVFMVKAPGAPVLAAITSAGLVAIFARYDDGQLVVSTSPDPWQEGPVLAQAWAHSEEKAQAVAERLGGDMARLSDPAAFLDAFERYAVIAGARLHRVVIEEMEERAGVAAWQMERLKRRAGPLKLINREYKLRRLAGEELPPYREFVAQRLQEAPAA